MNKLISLIAGIIFGIGLVVSEMVNPSKVLAFLDLFGNWDPSLAFVMIGALIVSSPLFHLIKSKEKPLLAEKFNYSKNKEIDNISGCMTKLLAIHFQIFAMDELKLLYLHYL